MRANNINTHSKIERSVLFETIGSTPASRDTIEYAITAVFSVRVRDLRSPTRGTARIAFARQVGMYLAHVACGCSFSDVGRIFDRDRTTVAHACGLVEDRRDDVRVDRMLDLLEVIVYRLTHVTGPAFSPLH